MVTECCPHAEDMCVVTRTLHRERGSGSPGLLCSGRFRSSVQCLQRCFPAKRVCPALNCHFSWVCLASVLVKCAHVS